MTTLKRLRELDEQASPGLWKVGCWGLPYMIGWEHSPVCAVAADEGGLSETAKVDAELIAAIRNNFAALLDIAEAAKRYADEWEASDAGAGDFFQLAHARRQIFAALSRLEAADE